MPRTPNNGWIWSFSTASLLGLALAPAVFSGDSSLSFREYERRYPGEKAMREYLQTQREAFLGMIEDVVLLKIALDIEAILKQGWADEVSDTDLFHAHVVLKRDSLPRLEYPEILSGEDVRWLYHAHEYDGQSDSRSRNILSTLMETPHVVHPPRTPPPGEPFTVQGEDLGGWYGANVYFALSPEALERHRAYFKRRPIRAGRFYFGVRETF